MKLELVLQRIVSLVNSWHVLKYFPRTPFGNIVFSSYYVLINVSELPDSREELTQRDVKVSHSILPNITLDTE